MRTIPFSRWKTIARWLPVESWHWRGGVAADRAEEALEGDRVALAVRCLLPRTGTVDEYSISTKL